MAAIFKASSYPLFLCLIILFASQFLVINCTEFEVGGRIGWVVPDSKDKDDMYNRWASQNRFKIGDTVRKTAERERLRDIGRYAAVLLGSSVNERCKSEV